MVRLLVYAVIIIAAIIVGTQVEDDAVFGAVAGLATGFAIPLVDLVFQHIRYVKLAVVSVRFYNTDVRVSASILMRIQLRDRYMLVRGHRYPNQYQPVGGVLKASEQGRALLSKWSAVSDDLIPVDDRSEGDLRIRLKGKYLLPFMLWYEGGNARETSPWREFYEELLAPEVLSTNKFPHIYYDFVKRKIHPRHSPQAGMYEVLIADVVELLPSAEQRKDLERTMDPAFRSDEIQWVTADTIRRRGAVPGSPGNFEIPITGEWTL